MEAKPVRRVSKVESVILGACALLAYPCLFGLAFLLAVVIANTLPPSMRGLNVALGAFTEPLLGFYRWPLGSRLLGGVVWVIGIAVCATSVLAGLYTVIRAKDRTAKAIGTSGLAMGALAFPVHLLLLVSMITP
jgi:hypothetical protein